MSSRRPFAACSSKLAVVLAVLACLVAAACTGSPGSTPSGSKSPGSNSSGSNGPAPGPSSALPSSGGNGHGASFQQPSGVFGPSSIWHQQVADAPLSSNSDGLVDHLVGEVQQYHAFLNAFQYNVSWYTVSADQAETTMHFDNCQHKPATPPGLFGRGGQFTDVPIPDTAQASAGTDSTLSIYRPATDQLWEFWQASRSTDGTWSACWGGRLDHVSTGPGYFTNQFGTSATGIASEGGDITIHDATSGVIDHALTLGVPQPAVYKNFVWPAQRSDGGSTDPDAIPEGTRLRLDPDLDIASLHLSPLATMIARAAQRYGFVVADKAGAVTIRTESGAPTMAATGTNPWTRLLAGTPATQVLDGFPWDHLQVIDPAWKRPAQAH